MTRGHFQKQKEKYYEEHGAIDASNSFWVAAVELRHFHQARKVTAQNSSHDPTWCSKYEFIRDNGGDASPLSTSSATVGSNVDVSNECGPQSETFITINPNKPKILAAGSNEIFRLPMRGYFSSNGGTSWGGVDLPLPPPKGANGIDFGSDPTLAFDTQGNVFYGYIVVFFGNGSGVKEVKWRWRNRPMAARLIRT